ncbi:zincin [Thozetella sp. PMI_491]|nr:zincin [Thozetella sp. PMI_491]
MAANGTPTTDEPPVSEQVATSTDENTPLLEDQDPESGEIAAPEPADRAKQSYWVSLAFGLFLVAIFIILVVLFAVFRPSRDDMFPSAGLCLTPACIHAADKILSSLSPNYQQVDPCTNFEEFACGGWRATHDLRPDQSSVGGFSIMSDDANAVIRHILEGSYPSDSNHSPFSPLNLAVALENTDQVNFNTLKRAYNACMAVDHLKEVGIKPLRDQLNEVPVLKNTKDLSAPILYLETIGVGSFLDLYASEDDKDPETVVVFAGPRGGYGLSNPYYQRSEIVAQYETVVGEVFKAINPGSYQGDAAAFSKIATDVVALESKLAAAAPTPEESRDVTKSYNPMSLKDTTQLAPALGLDHVLKALVPSNYTVDRMITQFPDFFKNVSTILADTPVTTVQNFFYWRLIVAYASSVIAPEIVPWTQFQNKLKGKAPDATPERWRTCNNAMDSTLTWILSRFYIEAAFSEKAKKLGDKVVSDIKKQFISRLNALEWMDDSVKKLAADKVNAIDQKIGYPTRSPDIMNPKSLQEYYAGLTVTDEYFANDVSASKFDAQMSWAKLGKPVDHGQWGMSASTVNAYYSPPGNEIVFPAGIMQFPMFGADLPMYMNYGAFGAVAGHELSHAFDNNGRLYDVHGRYKDWWTNSTIAAFDKRSQCFVDEYSNLTIEGSRGTEHVNGKLTLGENIADAGGLHAAYQVWLQYVKDSPEPNLPGLEYFTQQQVFYLSYSSIWCTKATKEQITQGILTDPHSPSSLRIVGSAMMNSRGFREAFSCPVKEPVCELW